MRIPCTARRSNQSILKEVIPEYSSGRTDAEAEALVLWPPDAKSRLFGKDLMLGKIEDKRRRGLQRVRWLDSIINTMNMSLSELWEIMKNGEAWYVAVYGVAKSQTQLGD